MHYLRQILSFIFLLIPGIIHAQSEEVNKFMALIEKRSDSLIKLLPSSPDDSLKVTRLIAISMLQQEEKPVKKDYAVEALAIAKKIKFQRGIMWAIAELGAVHQKNNDYQTAISYYKKAIDLAEAGAFFGKDEDYYPALLNLYFYLGDYPNAMEAISREMLLAEKRKDKKKIAHCYNILGYIHFKQENFEAAESGYNKYINLATELNDGLLLIHALSEISDVYSTEKKYKEAVNVLSRTIFFCDSLLADTGSVNYSIIHGWAPQYKGKALYRMSKTYKMMGDNTLAKKYALQAIELSIQHPTSKYEIAGYYINTGDIFFLDADYPNALQYLYYGYRLSREIQHRENTRDAAEYLSQTYAALQQYDSAFYFFKIYTRLKDSIVNNETKMKIAGIQGQYDVAKKDKEITRQQQIRNILIGSFIFLLIVLLLLYNSYRLKQKNKYQQELNRQQNELFNAIVTTQDQERKRIAQDIHDSLGSVLSAAKLKLSSLEESKKILSPDQLEKYQASLDLLDEASTELRNISHNIMPATLSKLGLEAALQNLIDKIAAHSNMQVHFSAHGFEGRMEEKTEMSIYRIILELLNNIVKHAAAEKVSIQLIKYPAYTNLMVEDNGRGFDYYKAFEEKKGIGLGNILSRVEYMNGSVEIDSSPGKGTTVIIEIPCTT
ncbi:MAG: sensor histidine kinase [Ferruginibacter sp.]